MVADSTLIAASQRPLGASSSAPLAGVAPTLLDDSPEAEHELEHTKPTAEDAKDLGVLHPAAEDHTLDQLNYSEHGGKGPHADVDGADADADPADMQRGVRQMRAITSVWSKKALVLTYVFIWFLYFVNGWANSITGNLGPYIVSDFESHSLIPVIGTVSSVMAGASYPPIAKMLNLWDRAYGFAFMTFLATLGLILSATCNNIQTYCAAQVFYSIGIGGMIFSIDVITADTSSLKDRGLAYAFTSSPYIITAFAGPKGAEGFYATNWRWGYGTFAIILPVIALPLVGNLVYNRKKAEKAGVLTYVSSGRTLQQSIWHFLIEVDALGMLLLAAGFVLFLLPFTIAGAAKDQWASPHIIAMLVVGFVLLVAFGVHERFTAPKPFLPYQLLTSRTILGACLIDVLYTVSYYCWSSYFTSFLQVVYSTSVAEAGYIQNTFDVVNGFWLIVVGFAIRRTGRFKWLLYFCIPLFLLGIGLMIHFRQPHGNVGYIVMCQLFTALGGGALIIIAQVAVLASSPHENAAAALSLLNLFGTIGGAIGNSISGAIWTNTFRAALVKYLPEVTLPDVDLIYEDLDMQLSFDWGDPTRDAIVKAYGVAQKNMTAAGTGIMAVSIVFIFLIRNIKVSEIAQVKGLLF